MVTRPLTPEKLVEFIQLAMERLQIPKDKEDEVKQYVENKIHPVHTGSGTVYWFAREWKQLN